MGLSALVNKLTYVVASEKKSSHHFHRIIPLNDHLSYVVANVRFFNPEIACQLLPLCNPLSLKMTYVENSKRRVNYRSQAPCRIICL